MGHNDHVDAVVFSPDGKTVATASGDRTIILWDVVTGIPLRTLKGHSSSVRHVAFSTDCKQLISASLDNTVRL